MQSNRAMNKVHREIELAAVMLGFPRRVSCAQVERECFSLHQRLKKKEPVLDRFVAVANLFLLMDLARTLDSRIAALQSDLVERSGRVRELVAKVAA